MTIPIWDKMLNVVAQRGVLVLTQAFGFGYLYLAQRATPFNRDEAIVGVILVLIGALFEGSIAITRVRYLSQGIERDRVEIERLGAKLEDRLTGLETRVEKRQDQLQDLLGQVGRGSLPPPKPTPIDDETSG